MMLRTVISEHERGFVFIDGAFKRFLRPGVHTLFHPFKSVVVRRASILEPKLEFADMELIAAHPEAAAELVTVRIADTQRGLVFKKGNFQRFLAPGFHAFLRTPVELTIEVLEAEGLELKHPRKDVLVRAPGAASFLRVVDVAEGHRGVLFVDQVQERVLAPGRYVFFTGVKELAVQVVELREQAIEIQGQELMTQDKVSLRVNLSVRFQVTDPVVALNEQSNFRDAFYRDLQLALRDEIGAHPLDVLLGRKEQVGAAIVERVRPMAATMGLKLLGAGLRDVILPGEMRTIFNQVIEAEKRAQANMIHRREETAATRNLMNTAKLLESSPVLMRLKELEAAEKIAEKVGTLSVHDGLGGLMGALSGFVRLNGDEVK